MHQPIKFKRTHQLKAVRCPLSINGFHQSKSSSNQRLCPITVRSSSIKSFVNQWLSSVKGLFLSKASTSQRFPPAKALTSKRVQREKGLNLSKVLTCQRFQPVKGFYSQRFQPVKGFNLSKASTCQRF